MTIQFNQNELPENCQRGTQRNCSREKVVKQSEKFHFKDDWSNIVLKIQDLSRFGFKAVISEQCS